MIRVAHVITGLGGGGAEAALARLVATLPRERFVQQVIALGDGGVYEAALRPHCESVETLGLGRPGALVHASRRLHALFVGFRPTLIQTWLCHADLLATVAARRLHDTPVIWGVHEAAGADRSAWTTRAVRWARNRLFARVPARVVCAARAGRDACVAAGLDPARIVVISNGIDTDAFRPDPAARAKLRGELGISMDVPVLAWASRWHPDKDPENLFAALVRLRQRHPALRVIAFGHALDRDNHELVAAIARHDLADTLVCLGFRDDTPALFAASDAAVVSSRTEALPNVVLEAMASALPVVATDVGDMRELVAHGGRLVAAGDADALAHALCGLLDKREALPALGATARRHIVEHYGIDRMTEAYAALYADVADGR